MKQLETERLILRDWRLDDLDDLYEYAKNKSFGVLTGRKPHDNKEESAKALDGFISDTKNDRFGE